MRFLNEVVISAGDTTGDLASAAILADNLFAASVHVVITTAGTGTVNLEATNDNPTAGVAPSGFKSIANVATTGAGIYIIPKTDVCYQYIRVTYVHTSGTGTLTAKLHAQGF